MKLRYVFFLALLTTSPACVAYSLPTSSAASARVYSDELSPRLTMNQRRAAHTATRLHDGTVLFAGGFTDSGRGNETTLVSAELYDPKTNTFTPLANMTEPRVGHGAVLLPDGRVLLVGGWGEVARLAGGEIYDPRTKIFSRAASMTAPRADMTVTGLRDGRVLIAGGFQARHKLNDIAEIYDPRTGVFSATGKMAESRGGHTATALKDGTVLIVGGTGLNERVLQTAEIFDPDTNQFERVGGLNAPRRKHAAVLLNDGRVLIVGGSDERDWRGQYRTTEIYDPKTRTFAPGPALNADRFKLADAVVALANSQVLVGGGDRLIERFDVTANRFVSGRQLDQGYFFATSTLLTDGRVLIAGGYDRDIVVSDGAWVYRGASG